MSENVHGFDKLDRQLESMPSLDRDEIMRTVAHLVLYSQVDKGLVDQANELVGDL